MAKKSTTPKITLTDADPEVGFDVDAEPSWDADLTAVADVDAEPSWDSDGEFAFDVDLEPGFDLEASAYEEGDAASADPDSGPPAGAPRGRPGRR